MKLGEDIFKVRRIVNVSLPDCGPKPDLLRFVELEIEIAPQLSSELKMIMRQLRLAYREKQRRFDLKPPAARRHYGRGEVEFKPFLTLIPAALWDIWLKQFWQLYAEQFNFASVEEAQRKMLEEVGIEMVKR